ncbi:MAG: hypothetical protein Q8M08_17470 [Bacteroidales bacterium]|nr:hypothetical protein [Bacteroidales bacterium]
MKNLFLSLALILISVVGCSQSTTFKSISFVDGGSISQCAFAPTNLTFNNVNYVSFPGFGTTGTTAAYGNHTHADTSPWTVVGNDIHNSNSGMVAIGITTGYSGNVHKLYVVGGLLSNSNATGSATPLYGIMSVNGSMTPAIKGRSYAVSGNNSVIEAEAINSCRGINILTQAGTGLYVKPNTGYAAIFETGNVGIGVTAPVQKLEVNGQVNATNGLFGSVLLTGSEIRTAGTDITLRAGTNGNAVQGINFQTNPGTGVVPRAVILANGNMGVGLTNPGQKLEVSGTTKTTALMVNGYNVSVTDNCSLPQSLSGAVTAVTATSPIVSTGGTTPNISIPKAGHLQYQDGYLSWDDFSYFEGKVNVVYGSAPLSSSGGVSPTISISKAGKTTDGYLSAADWNTFNDKIPGIWEDISPDIYYDKGNVGILTTLPQTALDVNGVITANGGNSDDWNSKLNNVLVNDGDIIIGISPPGEQPIPTVLSRGSSGQVLTIQTGSSLPGTHGLEWKTPTTSQWIINGSNIYYPSGNVGIGTTTTTNTINFDGTAARKISVIQNTTSAVNGSSLTLEAGSTLTGNSNKAGGNIILNAGTSTGNQKSSLSVNLSPQGTGGTATNNLQEVMVLDGNGNFNIRSNYIYNPQFVVTSSNNEPGSGSYFNFQRSLNTWQSPVRVNPWTTVGTFVFRPFHRGAYTNTANFNSQVTDTTGVTPSTIMTFQTTNTATANNNFIFYHNGYFSISPASWNAPTTFLDIVGDKMRLRNSKTPASATASGNAGDICWDANFIYICTATNTWKRVAISTW